MAYVGLCSSFADHTVYPLEQFNNRWVLIPNKIPYIMENICKHRQAIIVDKPTDFFGSISCPLHGWTYNTNGELLGEPADFFEEKKCLRTKELYEKFGLLWSENPQIDWDAIPMRELWNPQNYVYHNSVVMQNTYNIDYYLEAVLDSYHIPYVHPGLSNFCDVSTYQQITGTGFAFQSTKLHAQFKSNPSENYQKFQQHIEQNYANRWQMASIWLVLFPNLIIDHYPGTCIVYSIWPTDTGCYTKLDFLYEDDIAAFDPEFIRLQQACFNESQDEDDILSLRYQKGRTNLAECYTHPMESQINDYYAQNFYQKFMRL